MARSRVASEEIEARSQPEHRVKAERRRGPRTATAPSGMVGTRLAGGRRPGVKTVLFGLVLVSLVGLVGAALMRDVSGGSRTAAASRPAVPTPRPALTAAEEGYAQALWPIHNDVKASALKLTMAGI